MSLAEQSQQWFPTSVQVTVHQARNLRIKGKSGTNDAYAIIQVAKDKFSTSVAERSVSPVWKEEASFDLPLFHPSNAERCTLFIIVMHRAHVGLDKFLGQAVIDLLGLHDDKHRKKNDWYKLVDKSGKEDKPRGEVLLDIVFLRNNLSASMFDLSMQDKPRSRISKLKDKVRGKKSDGFSDSASAIVPSVSQVLTDSDGEADSQSLNQSPGVKKKSKLKKLFAPKTNLHRNVSQSMSTLGNLPEKNSSLSGSRSSGLNTESPEVKKKFKFLGHKRTSSTDSKSSLGPFSLLGRSKQNVSDPNSKCINGSHVYTEEAEPPGGSTLSLNSSGHSSSEDVRKRTLEVPVDVPVDVPEEHSAFPVPTYKYEAPDRAALEQQHHLEEQRRQQLEDRQMAERRRMEEEERRRAEALRRQEEEERRYHEEQEKRRQREEEEEERRRQDQRKMEEATERRRLQEEAQRAEEQKKQEEASMSDRISTLFGMIRKKEEKKEEVPTEETPAPAPHGEPGQPDLFTSQHSANPFVEVPLNPDPTNQRPAYQDKPVRTPQPPSAMAFLNRTAKVSAVKPRLDDSLQCEPADAQSDSSSPGTPGSTRSSVPSESPVAFASLHTSLAPPSLQHRELEPTRENLEDTSPTSSPDMSGQKQRAPVPPSYPPHVSPRTSSLQAGNHVPTREFVNPGYVQPDQSHGGKTPSIPLPDYETLFPEKRHGVHGQTKWDHLVAEVNQRHRDKPVEEHEMSVDGPEEPVQVHKASIPPQSLHTPPQPTKPVSRKLVSAPPPPTTSPPYRPGAESGLKQSHSPAQPHPSAARSAPPAALGSMSLNTSARPAADVLSSVVARDRAKKALLPPSPTVRAPSPTSQSAIAVTPKDTQRPVSVPASVPVPASIPVAAAVPKQSQRPVQPHSSAARSNPPGTLTSASSNSDARPADVPSSMVVRDTAKNTQLSPPATTRAPSPTRQTPPAYTTPKEHQTPVAVPSSVATELPKAKPRVKGKEPRGSTEAELSPAAPDRTPSSIIQTPSRSPDTRRNTENKPQLENFANFDPFPSVNLLPSDPWAPPEVPQAKDDFFDDLFSTSTPVTRNPQERGMTAVDLDDIFAMEKPAQTFSVPSDSDPDKPVVSSGFHSNHSQTKKQVFVPVSLVDEMDSRPLKDPAPPEEPAMIMANHSTPPAHKSDLSAAFTPPPSTNLTMGNGGMDAFGADSAFATEPLPVIMEEAAPQAVGPAGGKTPLRAWVSPSEVQSVSGSGGGLPSLQRRPHPVKPMSTTENHPSLPPAVREMKSHDGNMAKIKTVEQVGVGPYTQLTQDELITLVVKQQGDLSKKEAKIVELEQYIDNLLVRVIEEKPSILGSLESNKLM